MLQQIPEEENHWEAICDELGFACLDSENMHPSSHTFWIKGYINGNLVCMIYPEAQLNNSGCCPNPLPRQLTMGSGCEQKLNTCSRFLLKLSIQSVWHIYHTHVCRYIENTCSLLRLRCRATAEQYFRSNYKSAQNGILGRCGCILWAVTPTINGTFFEKLSDNYIVFSLVWTLLLALVRLLAFCEIT